MTADRQKLAETARHRAEGIRLKSRDWYGEIVPFGHARDAELLDALAEPCQECDMWETRSDVVVETMERYKTRAEAAESELSEWKDIAPAEIATPGLFEQYVNAMSEAHSEVERQLAEAREALQLWQRAAPVHRSGCSPFGVKGCTCGLNEARERTRSALASMEGGEEA